MSISDFILAESRSTGFRPGSRDRQLVGWKVQQINMGDTRMKKILLFLVSILLSMHVSAGECTGTIVEVRNDISACGGYYAYRISENVSYWLCSDSDLSDSFILTAFSLQTTVIAYLPGGGACATALNQDFLLQDAIELVP